jgi:DHA2 family multidrug resistance protein-like MFS transporter
MMAANGTAIASFAWLAVAVIVFAALAQWEKRTKSPLFDPAVFCMRGPGLLYLIAVLTGIPIFSVTMYSAAYYMAQFKASAGQAGLALLALALPLGAGQGLGGWLSKRTSARALLTCGLVGLATGEVLLAYAQSVLSVLCAFAVIGFGVGLASAPPNLLLLRYVNESRSGAATGVLTMLSSTGAITAPAAVSAFLHYSALPSAQSFRLEFLVAFVLAVLAIPLAAALPDPPKS